MMPVSSSAAGIGAVFSTSRSLKRYNPSVTLRLIGVWHKVGAGGAHVIAMPYESPDGPKVGTFGAGQLACEFGFPLFERLDDPCGGP